MPSAADRANVSRARGRMSPANIGKWAIEDSASSIVTTGGEAGLVPADRMTLRPANPGTYRVVGFGVDTLCDTFTQTLADTR